MDSLAASLAMVDRTFSVAIRFSEWFVTCDCECSNFRSVEKRKKYASSVFIWKLNCINLSSSNKTDRPSFLHQI
jgi:hypothetical protein